MRKTQAFEAIAPRTAIAPIAGALLGNCWTHYTKTMNVFDERKKMKK